MISDIFERFVEQTPLTVLIAGCLVDTYEYLKQRRNRAEI
jgi:hypothetical protein